MVKRPLCVKGQYTTFLWVLDKRVSLQILITSSKIGLYGKRIHCWREPYKITASHMISSYSTTMTSIPCHMPNSFLKNIENIPTRSIHIPVNFNDTCSCIFVIVLHNSIAHIMHTLNSFINREMFMGFFYWSVLIQSFFYT